MALKLHQNTTKDSWTQLLVEESEISLHVRGAKRARTFRRMYMTVFVSFTSIALVYCSLFYVGAFIDFGKIRGVSYSQSASKAREVNRKAAPKKKKTRLNVLTDAFTINRIYLRKGQAVQATFTIPENTFINLKIKQCASRPIFEIFSCKFVGEQVIEVNDKTKGYINFKVNEPGFYYFEGKVTRVRSALPVFDESYKIVWQRA